MFGDASVAQSVLSKGASGDFFSINWGFGIAVMLGIFVSGGVTGGHLNPAVTLAMAIGKVPFLYYVSKRTGWVGVFRKRHFLLMYSTVFMLT